ncbi:MAG: FHA domain-containing protein [Planctomycetota bacterium]|jgi:hypothetical protein
MKIARLILGAALLLLGTTTWIGLFGGGASLGPMLFGVGFGVLGATVFDLLSEAFAEGARTAPPVEPVGGAFEPSGTICPTCRRPLLPGMRECPFCHPTVPQESVLEQTVHREYEVDVKLHAMPGLAAATRMMLDTGALGFLHVFEGTNKGQSILLSNTTVSVGRAADNNVILGDGGISQHHAQIIPEGRGFRVRDAGSRNGTFVNDVRVDSSMLQTGDVLACGESRIYVQLR